MEVLTPQNLQEDFEDFFETSLCGFVTATPKGEILRLNQRLAGWLGRKPVDFQGKRFSDLLTIGGKIYFETHLSPLLRMQGFFDEVALELSAAGTKLPVLVNASVRKSPDDQPLFTRFTVVRATDRRLYEQSLQAARAVAEEALAEEKQTAQLREQFIAVLGHDLRNPLGGISGALSLLKALPQEPRGKAVIKLAEDSLARMSGLISDIMDFARGRLGSGMTIRLEQVDLEKTLRHVVEEIQAAWPDRQINALLHIPFPVLCDSARISQLLSNLLANAMTHGAAEGAVSVVSAIHDDRIEISVVNTGAPIPAAALGRLFEPFTREDHRPSQNGLGLGLYIASQVAKAHRGHLWATSDAEETRFTFSIPRSADEAQS